MRQENTYLLHQYWDHLRGRRSAPERNDIDPSLISPALPDVFILDFETGTNPAFRLVGTRICALFGRELTGEVFSKIFSKQESAEIQRLVAGVARSETPLLAGILVHFERNLKIPFELLLLPLRHRGMRSQRMLGLLTAAQDLPLFLPAAISMSLMGIKMIDQEMIRKAARTPSLQTGVPASEIISRKGHLILIQGSQDMSKNEKKIDKNWKTGL